jgi:hypothetical protein
VRPWGRNKTNGEKHTLPFRGEPSTTSWQAIPAPRWMPPGGLASLPSFNPCRGSAGRRSPAHPLHTPARRRRATSARTRPAEPRSPMGCDDGAHCKLVDFPPRAVSRRDTIPVTPHKLPEGAQCGVEARARQPSRRGCRVPQSHARSRRETVALYIIARTSSACELQFTKIG